MTKSVKLIITFAVIAVLILAFFLVSSLMRKSAEEKQEAARQEVIKITDLPEGSVRKITLDNPGVDGAGGDRSETDGSGADSPGGLLSFARSGDSWFGKLKMILFDRRVYEELLLDACC